MDDSRDEILELNEDDILERISILASQPPPLPSRSHREMDAADE